MSSDASTETDTEEEDERAASSNGAGHSSDPAAAVGQAAMEPAASASARAGAGDDEGDNFEPSFFEDPSQVLKTIVIVVVLVAAIYIAVPKIAGLDDALVELGKASRWWIGVAVLATVLTFAADISLFRGVVGRDVVDINWRECYQINMAGLAATRLFSAGGAGGILLTYWALRKAGMSRVESGRRMVAYLMILYGVYILAVIIFGILLRTGVLPGDGPVSVTIVPAAIAGVVGLLVLGIAFIPADLQRRLDERIGGEGRWGRWMTKLAALPATLGSGVRLAWEFIRHPRSGWLAVGGAAAFWATNVMTLWASFRSLGIAIPLGEIVVGFFVGMAANLAPAPAGVGAVDGGLIGVFAIFGYPLESVIAAVLIYRLIAFYLPVPPGIVAFFQLRATVARWDAERAGTMAGETPAERVEHAAAT